MNFDTCKFIIFGYNKTYSTHRHIHEAFYRILKYMGREVLWVDWASDLANVDLDNSFFITEGHHTELPLVSDAFYAIHNLKDNPLEEKMKPIRNKFQTWGVTGRNTLARENYERFGPVTMLDSYSAYFPECNEIYFPWATDLVPEEIYVNKSKATLLNRGSNTINWVGYLWGADNLYTNAPQIADFKRACAEQNIKFNPWGCTGKRIVTIEENIQLIQNSYFAPAIQSQWQVDAHYIPCRIFKNISYGMYGVTNSAVVNDLFGGKLIYNPDCYRMFYDAQQQLPEKSIEDLHKLMDLIAEQHTYINRINVLLQAAKIAL